MKEGQPVKKLHFKSTNSKPVAAVACFNYHQSLKLLGSSSTTSNKLKDREWSREIDELLVDIHETEIRIFERQSSQQLKVYGSKTLQNVGKCQETLQNVKEMSNNVDKCKKKLKC
jgi:hypothetical protein